MPEGLSITVHDDCPRAEAGVIDAGLGASNDAAAPLHEVQPLSCFARLPSGQVIGGAVGRSWGSCCELQQLWVEPSHRQRGIGSQLVARFERHAMGRGCDVFYLETFNFQAPQLYRALGYRSAHDHAVYPHGIVRHLMVKRLAAAPVVTAPRIGIGVIAWRAGRVLLGQRLGSHGAGTWALPGGHLEFGESVEQCAARELLEETGLEVEPAALSRGPYIDNLFAGEGLHYVTLFVVAHSPAGEPQLREPAKCAGWSWWPWSALPQPLFPPLDALRASGYQPDVTP
jgi:8-oxo-dGTP diphosphatase